MFIPVETTLESNFHVKPNDKSECFQLDVQFVLMYTVYQNKLQSYFIDHILLNVIFSRQAKHFLSHDNQQKVHIHQKTKQEVCYLKYFPFRQDEAGRRKRKNVKPIMAGTLQNQPDNLITS